MDGSPHDYSRSLKTQAEMLVSASAFDAKTTDQPERDGYCRLILLRTSDLVGSCSQFIAGRDIVAGQIIMRSMLEDLIHILWATLSESNANHLICHGLDEFKRAFRINLQAGTAQVLDREGNDHSRPFLESDRFGPTVEKKSVASMATEAGATGLYDMFYRFTSLHTHGNVLDELRTNDPQDVSVMLGAIAAISKATGHIGIRWLLGRERPSNTELLDVLCPT